MGEMRGIFFAAEYSEDIFVFFIDVFCGKIILKINQILKHIRISLPPRKKHNL